MFSTYIEWNLVKSINGDKNSVSLFNVATIWLDGAPDNTLNSLLRDNNVLSVLKVVLSSTLI